MFFDGSAAFETFLTTMRKDRTWGNELTLRAITDYYGEYRVEVTDATLRETHYGFGQE